MAPTYSNAAANLTGTFAHTAQLVAKQAPMARWRSRSRTRLRHITTADPFPFTSLPAPRCVLGLSEYSPPSNGAVNNKRLATPSSISIRLRCAALPAGMVTPRRLPYVGLFVCRSEGRRDRMATPARLYSDAPLLSAGLCGLLPLWLFFGGCRASSTSAPSLRARAPSCVRRRARPQCSHTQTMRMYIHGRCTFEANHKDTHGSTTAPGMPRAQ